MKTEKVTLIGNYGEKRLSSYSITETSVELVMRAKPLFTYTVIGPNSIPPDMVWKEVWEVENGKLVRRPDIIGTHHKETTLPERIEFP